MGVSFDTPARAAPADPGARLTTIGLYLSARRRVGAGRRRVALVLRTVLLTALVLALAGFRIVLPVDRLATVFVVDLSDSVGNAGREDALAFLRETARRSCPKGDVAGIVAFGKEALVERLPSDLAEIDRTRLDPGALGDRHRGCAATRDRAVPRRRPEAHRPAVRRQRHDRRRPGRGGPRRDPRHPDRDAAIGLGASRRGAGRTGRDTRRRRTSATSIEAVGRHPLVGRPAGDRPAVRRRRERGDRNGSTSRQGVTRVTFDVTPTEAGFHTFRVVVEAARDTFSQNDRADSNDDRQGRAADPGAGRQRGRRDRARRGPDRAAPEGRHDRARGAADRLRRPRRLRQRRARRRAADPAVGPAAGRAPGLRPRPRQGPGDDRRTGLATAPVATRRRRSRRRCRSTWASATARSSPTSRSSSSSTSRVRWTPATATRSTAGRRGGTGIGGVRKVDIGKEAILRAAAALTERDELGVVSFNEQAHWVVETQPLGRSATCRARSRASSRSARRTSSPASSRRSSRSRTRPPRDATSSC